MFEHSDLLSKLYKNAKRRSGKRYIKLTADNAHLLSPFYFNEHSMTRGSEIESVRTQIAKKLIDIGADITLKNKGGHTAWELAIAELSKCQDMDGDDVELLRMLDGTRSASVVNTVRSIIHVQ